MHIRGKLGLVFHHRATAPRHRAEMADGTLMIRIMVRQGYYFLTPTKPLLSIFCCSDPMLRPCFYTISSISMTKYCVRSIYQPKGGLTPPRPQAKGALLHHPLGCKDRPEWSTATPKSNKDTSHWLTPMIFDLQRSTGSRAVIRLVRSEITPDSNSRIVYSQHGPTRHLRLLVRPKNRDMSLSPERNKSLSSIFPPVSVVEARILTGAGP